MKFKSKLFLAPISGVTDLAFRLISLEYGAGLVTIPMINVNALTRKNKATFNLLKTIPEEKPKAVQLFGTKLDLIKKAAKIAYKETNCDVLDFNMGCPINNIISQGAGAALLKRPEKIKQITETLRSSVDIPISIKIRLGGSEKSINIIKNAKIIEKAGADILTIHARTIDQKYSGSVNLDYIKQVKENSDMFIIGNGDITDGSSAKHMLEYTKCDAVMIGRASLGKPYIFEKINYYLKNNKELKKEYNYLDEYYKYYDLCLKHNDCKSSKLKEQTMYFTKGIRNKIKIREQLLKNINKDGKIIKKFNSL